MNDHTLHALPSYVEIDFIGEDHKVNLWETRVNNELGIIWWMGKQGLIEGKEQRTQVVNQAKQMEFLNSHDKKVSQVDSKGGTIVVDNNVGVADGVLRKDKLHVSKVLSSIQICIVLGLFIWWLFIVLL